MGKSPLFNKQIRDNHVLDTDYLRFPRNCGAVSQPHNDISWEGSQCQRSILLSPEPGPPQI